MIDFVRLEVLKASFSKVIEAIWQGSQTGEQNVNFEIQAPFVSLQTYQI